MEALWKVSFNLFPLNIANPEINSS